MMCGSASVHVCVDAGYKEGEPLGHVRRRWPAHHLGAVLLASFANSPMAEKRLTGRRSTFPPVRPRGHLELRVIDAQPGGDGWIVPLAVTAALFDDREATETACRAVRRAHARSAERPNNSLYEVAARDGLTDPELRRAAVICVTTALDALPRLGAKNLVTDAATEFSWSAPCRGPLPRRRHAGHAGRHRPRPAQREERPMNRSTDATSTTAVGEVPTDAKTRRERGAPHARHGSANAPPC
ncbi:gamma-glutamylcysteine synthetase [Streptomyces sp. B3I7]|nr:gamma-glutamylcysteine synthetase [Streptomyces sp. B3I7]